MKLLIVSIIIIVAVAAGLILGEGISGGFFSALVTGGASGPQDSGMEEEAAGSSKVPEFRIKIGSKSGGIEASENEEEEVEEEEEAPPANETEEEESKFTFTGGSTTTGGSPPADTGDDDDGNGGEETKEPALVYLSPASVTSSVNDTFSIDVVIEPREYMVYAATIRIKYDNDMLSALPVDSGDFFKFGGSETYDIKLYNESGIIQYDTTRIAVQEGTTEAGTAFTLNFRALATGNSTISFEGVDLISDSTDDDSIPSEPTGGSVNVQ
jgi:hypothetical protein